MKEGTKLRIRSRSEERVADRSKEPTEIDVTVIDTIQDVRNIVVTGLPSLYPVVTKYLVKDDNNEVFSIYTHQVRKVLT